MRCTTAHRKSAVSSTARGVGFYNASFQADLLSTYYPPYLLNRIPTKLSCVLYCVRVSVESVLCYELRDEAEKNLTLLVKRLGNCEGRLGIGPCYLFQVCFHD